MKREQVNKPRIVNKTDLLTNLSQTVNDSETREGKRAGLQGQWGSTALTLAVSWIAGYKGNLEQMGNLNVDCTYQVL